MRSVKKIQAGILLLITTFFWGVTFTIVKDAVNQVDVFVFLSQRFLIASAIMLPLALARASRLNPRLLVNGCVLGILLFASYAFQTMALQYTSASNTGFLTGLNVVLVPLFGALLFRLPAGPGIRWGVGLAAPGLFLLCGNGSLSFNYGDILAAVCGGCVALHLLYTSHFSRQATSDVYLLTTLQLTVVGLLSLATATVRGKEVFVWHPELLWTLVVCVLIATIFAFLVQTTMQKFISPAHTALIFCTEPVFAAAYAYYAAGERLGFFGVTGAALILAGMIVSELLPDEGKEGEEVAAVTAEG
ncbi:membrane protein [Geoanaerobacter pelophilus]|uniref:Membrane protein n=1 Tax=Geoanaerobacter pelophilus TaxID=60036 RepID=A0ABQ0MHM3_9BACT|nr:DMT family transporter [Geoanaerobacter pelophilus]GAW66581.1 membrane protein [Geoanaerobacter pelophilus]